MWTLAQSKNSLVKVFSNGFNSPFCPYFSLLQVAAMQLSQPKKRLATSATAQQGLQQPKN